MGNRDRRAALRQRAQRLLNRLLAFGVDVARGFVEDQDRRIVENRPGDRHALAFAAGEAGAAFAEPGVVAERRVEDEVVSLGRLGRRRSPARACWSACRRPGFARSCRGTRTVPAARSRCAAADRATRQLAHVDAVDQHAAFAGVVEPAEQIDERRLAAAAAADDADRFAGPDFEVDVAEHRLMPLVAERDVFELDVAPSTFGRSVGCSASFGVDRRVEQFEGALATGEKIGKPGRELRERRERRVEHRQVGEERHQRAERHLAVEHVVPADVPHDQAAEAEDELHRRRERDGRVIDVPAAIAEAGR